MSRQPVVVELKQVDKSYQLGSQTIPVLRNINLTIRRGEYLSIMGPSGSGKSTLMNILGCLDIPTGGSYKLDSIQVGEMNDNELAAVRNSKIGFVFQTFNLLAKMTAYENVEVPLMYSQQKYRREDIERVLIQVGLKDRMTHRPNELSGGQRQRVAVARALVNSPRLLLADEPTGNLDTETGEQIMDLFSALNKKGITVLLVSHSPHITKYSRRNIFIVDGKICKKIAPHLL